MLTRILFVILTLFLGLGVLAGCQSTADDSDNSNRAQENVDDQSVDEAEDHSDDSDDTHEGERTVNITVTEFSITPADITVKAGEEIKFMVTNEGRYPHTYTIGNLNAEASPHPGETEDVEVVFDEPGEYHVQCSIAAHDEEGMVGTITVE